jgi:asparagine synthase (glutamine-hydrolysing)
MCGISGIIGSHDTSLIEKMNLSQAHRGPDDSGIYLDDMEEILFGHRRLSILDLEGGAQPMQNADKSLTIVYNGEIYNSPELRESLEKDGFRFVTKNSDTEVLLHLYQKKLFDMLKDLNGMFAFAIYDKSKNIVFCARDRVGIKPIYYSHINGKFAFSSELKALLNLPWISRDIDSNSLYHYISLQYVPSPNSIFTDIKKLPKGHYLTYDISNKKIDIKKYWDLTFKPNTKIRYEEWLDILNHKIQAAVNRWTLSDVPIACSLSGGLDSSTIVGMLTQAGHKQIRTYSLGFDGEGEDKYSELKLARKVAHKWGTEHHELIINPKELFDNLDKMVWHLDEPYGGGLPSWYVFEHIGRDYKVAMTGTGGDELFGNYGKWRIFKHSKLYLMLKSLKEYFHNRIPNTMKDAWLYPYGYFYNKYFSDAFKDKYIFDGQNNTHYKTEFLVNDLWQQSNNNSPENAICYIDFHMQLPEEFLHVTDRFSMAHSVEARVPFLDNELIELTCTVPSEIRTNSYNPKYLLRETIKDILPAELVHASKKGFILPLTLWTRDSLKDKITHFLNPVYLKKQGMFSTKIWDRIIRPHIESERDYTQQVWTLFMFQCWYNCFH